MRRLVYAVAILIGIAVAAVLNVRAAHVFALFPDRTGDLAGIVSGQSGLRAGRVLLGPDWSARWQRGRVCGLAACWDLTLTDAGGSEVGAGLRIGLADRTLRLDGAQGRLRDAVDLPTLGRVEAAIRIDTGTAVVALSGQEVRAGAASGLIDRLVLEGLDLGRGPVRLTVPERNRIVLTADLDGGPSRIEAEVSLDLSTRSGTVDVVFADVSGFPPDLRGQLRRITVEDGTRRRLRLRFSI